MEEKEERKERETKIKQPNYPSPQKMQASIRLKQDNRHEFETSLGYVVSSSLVTEK